MSGATGVSGAGCAATKRPICAALAIITGLWLGLVEMASTATEYWPALGGENSPMYSVSL